MFGKRTGSEPVVPHSRRRARDGARGLRGQCAAARRAAADAQAPAAHAAPGRPQIGAHRVQAAGRASWPTTARKIITRSNPPSLTP